MKTHDRNEHRALAIAVALLLLGCQPTGNAADGANAPGAQTAPEANPTAPVPGSPSAPERSQVASAADMEFYRKALSSGIGEVAASELAQQKADSEEVRQLAGRLVQDHRALNDKLREVSDMATDPAPPPESQAAANHLRGLEGEAFDSAWLEHMAEGHAKSIALYQTVAQGGQSEQARTLAAGALPQLREHAASIDRLRNDGDADDSGTANDEPAR